MTDLADYLLEVDGKRYGVSRPLQGAACGHAGGRLAFGLAAADVRRLENAVGQRARLLLRSGEEVARLHVRHVDTELNLLSGDLEGPQDSRATPAGATAPPPEAPTARPLARAA